MRTRTFVTAGAVLALATAGRASATESEADQITIGASIPLSGPLAGFGSFQKWGYTMSLW